MIEFSNGEVKGMVCRTVLAENVDSVLVGE